MIRIGLMPLVIAMVLCGVARTAAAQVSPFTAVEFEEDGTVMVRFEGEWAELVSIGGVSTDELVSGAREAFGSRWQKRIGEDLLDVFGAMGVTLERRDVVDLELMLDDEVVSVDDAPMTRANRQAVWRANQGKEDEQEEEYGVIATRDVLGRLGEIIESRHAYATLRVDDLEELIEAELRGLGEDAEVSDVRRAAQRVVAQLGDGHAGVREWRDGLPEGYLPYWFERAAGGVVVLHMDRSGLVDDGHPYLESIDGVPLERWLGGVRAYVPAGSDQYVESGSLRELQALNFARMTLGREAREIATLTLRDMEGSSRVEVEVRLDAHRARPAPRVGRATGRIGADIGYIRLNRMVPPDEIERKEWVGALRRELALATDGAVGLVIDVRGNGGGWRDPILALMPCLMGAEDKPVVVNAARYRLGEGDDPRAPGGYLDNRFLYPRAWPGWSERELGAIDRFEERFDPAWDVPDGRFSGWHYMVVSPGADDVPRFDGPVVVLMDSGCFSATDIFLAAMGELPGVTLMGTASGGGSARSQRYEIGPLEVRLATMASYQPNGQLFDGVGVPPDVTVEPDVGDLVGRGDTQLDRAIELIRDRFQESP